MSKNNNKQESQNANKLQQEIIELANGLDKNTTLLNRKELEAQSRLTAIIIIFTVQILGLLSYLAFGYNIRILYTFFVVSLFVQITMSYPIWSLITHKLMVNVEELEDGLTERKIQEELQSANESTRQNIMMRKNYFHLQKYYKQSLNQSKNIFYFGIFIAILGLASIPLIIYLRLENSSTLAIIQAILTGFVLVVFQLMYVKTNESVNNFYQGLIESYKENLKYNK